MRPRLDFVRCFDEHGSGFRPFNHHMKLSVDFATFHMALYPNPTLGTTVPDILHFMQTAVLSKNTYLCGELKTISCLCHRGLCCSKPS